MICLEKIYAKKMSKKKKKRGTTLIYPPTHCGTVGSEVLLVNVFCTFSLFFFFLIVFATLSNNKKIFIYKKIGNWPEKYKWVNKSVINLIFCFFFLNENKKENLKNKSYEVFGNGFYLKGLGREGRLKRGYVIFKVIP